MFEIELWDKPYHKGDLPSDIICGIRIADFIIDADKQQIKINYNYRDKRKHKDIAKNRVINLTETEFTIYDLDFLPFPRRVCEDCYLYDKCYEKYKSAE